MTGAVARARMGLAMGVTDGEGSVGMPSSATGERLGSFLELAPHAMIVVDERARIQHANPAAEELFGRARSELIGLDVAALVPEAAREKHAEHIRAFFTRPRMRPMGHGMELVALVRGGREVPVEISLSPVEVGPHRMVVAEIRDVSGRREATAELRATTERLESTFNVGVWELDLETRRYTCSRGALALLGRLEEVDGMPALADAVHPDDRGRLRDATVKAKRDGLPYRLELRVRHADGRHRWLENNVRPERGPSGRVEKLRGLVRDVTEQRDAALARAETSARLEALLANAPDLVLYCDLDGTIRFANRVTAPLTMEQVIGAPWSGFVLPERHAAAREALARALGSSEPVELEVPGIVPEGVWFSCHIGRVVRDAEVVGFVVIARDITARKRAEAQLAAAEQLASLGMMSGALAHELNNPLAAALWGLDFVLGEGDEPLAGLESAQRDALRDTREALVLLRGIVHDLKLFARAERSVEQQLDVNAVLSSTLRLARNELRHRARVVEALEAVPRVLGHEGRLGQVFLNLLVNAAQAIPEGDRDRNEIRVATRTEPDGRVRIDIRDSGVGMSAEVRARLFTPFFTTKPVGVGTALGLSICQRIVESFGGTLAVESAPGQGSTFSVLLPQSDRASSAGGASGAEPTTRARVLVLDDDVAVVRALVRRLGKHHDVVGVATAAEAFEELERRSVDAIVCDVMMPDTTGADFYEAVVRRWPERAPRFVFLTGGAFTDRARAFLSTTTAAVLQKPVELPELLAAIEALRAPPG